MITLKQSFDLIDGTFRELSGELLPVAVFYLEESHQVVRLEKHQTNKTPIELLVALNLVHELAAHMPVQLLFIHRQSQAFNHCRKILIKRKDPSWAFLLLTFWLFCGVLPCLGCIGIRDLDAGSFLEGPFVVVDEFTTNVDVAQEEQLAMDHLEAVNRPIPLKWVIIWIEL